MRLTIGGLLLALVCMSVAVALGWQTGTVKAEIPTPHIHVFPPTRASALPLAPPAGNLLYHGGPVVHAGTVYAIYWLPAGIGTSPDYQSLIDRYFADVGYTFLFSIVTQYPDTCCPPGVQSSSGSWLDTTPYPRAGTTSDPLVDADIQGEVVHAIAANPTWKPPGPDTAYFVFTGRDVMSCGDETKTVCFLAQYCAYHGSFVSGATTVLYANMPDAGTNLALCGAGSGPNGDLEADSEISIASHEHFEIVTDPQPNVNDAWSDADDFEIADKCAYSYGPLNPDNSNVVLHGHPYKVQQEWSNAVSACALALVPPAVGGVAAVPNVFPANAASPRGGGRRRGLLLQGAIAGCAASAIAAYAVMRRSGRLR